MRRASLGATGGRARTRALGLGLGLAGWLLGVASLPAPAPRAGQDSAPSPAPGAGPPADDSLAVVRELVAASCVGCHGGARPKAGLDLGEGALADVLADPELPGLVAEQVSAGAMPPPPPADAGAGTPPAGRAPLAEADRARLLAALGALAGPARPPRAARVRRLTRVQYARCVEDLTGLPFDPGDRFPPDAAAYGFDTVGDVMFLTDLQVERYFDAALEVLDSVEADPAASARLAGDPREVLARWMTTAFRRPPSAEELGARLALVAEVDGPPGAADAAAGAGDLRPALLSVLVSPAFLFRAEREHGADAPRPVDAYELASRLSFLCWARGPDARLLERAASGALLEEAVLLEELERLLDDPRSRSLADDFAAQWLGYREILTRGVDFRVYGGFGDGLKRDLYGESARAFDHLVRADRPLPELVTGDWTFLNARLAKHYGLPALEGGHLRHVRVEDPRRGGVLGQGSVLTLTSYPTRTSPVLRGAWILERLLDEPTPPPPADVTPLAAFREKRPTTVRERLEVHRADPGCAVCHDRIDPLGFALERFDGVGRLREEDGGRPVDDRALLPDGREVEGVADLKRVLGERPEALARTFVERLFVYAMGRPPEAWDAPALDALLERAAAEGWSTRALVRGLVRSEPFRTRGVAVGAAAPLAPGTPPGGGGSVSGAGSGD